MPRIRTPDSPKINEAVWLMKSGGNWGEGEGWEGGWSVTGCWEKEIIRALWFL
jgi:hypothetical protein